MNECGAPAGEPRGAVHQHRIAIEGVATLPVAGPVCPWPRRGAATGAGEPIAQRPRPCLTRFRVLRHCILSRTLRT